MMMVPYMFNEALMDDLFSNDWEHDFDRAMKAAAPRGMFGKRAANVMKTDVRENKDSYDVFVDLPGFKKDEITMKLENGTLTVSAAKGLDKDEEQKDKKYVRRERYAGAMSRSFYVGEHVAVEDIHDHKMHSEFYQMSKETADILNQAKKDGKRIISVGTTSTRTLETIRSLYPEFRECSGWTDIFIYPGYQFKAIDSLITNFHLPKSTLVMLVSALAGKEHIMNAYHEAIQEKYRFFSFGDSMFID